MINQEDQQLEDWLLRLEELAGSNCTATIPSLLERDRSLQIEIEGRPDLAPLLEEQFHALRRMNHLLQPSSEHRKSELPRIPGYEIEALIGHGGMGIVYRGRHLALSRQVAVKMLLAGRLAAPTLVQRFRYEAETIARLQHPNIVQVYEIGEGDAGPFIALEYLQGGSLAQRLMGRPQDERQSAIHLRTLAAAVAYAHGQGVIHRDLKPANILIAADGTLKIADFGLARLVDIQSTLTRTGDAPGTPSYMAPEQVRGDVSPLADVYALGALLYELLTGRPPFLAATSAETLILLQSTDPASPQQLRPRLSRDLETVCLHCLEKEPGQRYESAAALADDLQRFLNGQPILARRANPVERISKWARRRPAIATLLAIVALAGTVIVAGGIAFSIRLAAAVHAIDEREADLAKRAYAADMRQLAEDWDTLSRAASLEILDRYRPSPRQTDRRSFAWHHLHSRLRLPVKRFQGHVGQAYAVDFHPTLPLLASCGEDRTVRIWDIEASNQVSVLTSNSGPISNVRWSPDGASLAFSTETGELCLFTYGTIDRQLNPAWQVQAFDGDLRFFAFSPDSTQIAHGGPGNRVTLWDRATGKCVRVEAFEKWSTSDPGGVGSLVFSAEGDDLIVAAPHDGHFCSFLTMGVHEPNSLRVWRSSPDDLGGHQWAASEMSFTPDDSQLVVACRGEGLRLLDAQTGKTVRVLPALPQSAHSVQFSHDGRWLLTACDDGVIRVWNPVDWSVARVFKGNSFKVWTARFSPDGKQIAACDIKGLVTLWDDLEPAETRWTVPGSEGPTSLTFLNDGAHLAVGTRAGQVELVDLDRQTVLKRAQVDTRLIAFLVQVAGTNRMIVGNDALGLAIWEFDREFQLQCRQQLENHHGVSVSQDGQLLTTNCDDGLWLMDGASLKPIRRVCEGAKHDHVLFEPRNRGVILATSDPQWQPQLAPEDRVWCIQGDFQNSKGSRKFSRNERIVAAHAEASALSLYDTHTGSKIGTLRGAQSVITAIEFSPDDLTLATGSLDGTVVIWDVATTRPMLTLSCNGPVRCLAFSPDGERLVAASTGFESAATTLHVWDADVID